MRTELPDRCPGGFFSLGNAGSLGPWLSSEIKATPEQLTDSLFECMPPTLRRAYAAQAKLEGAIRRTR